MDYPDKWSVLRMEHLHNRLVTGIITQKPMQTMPIIVTLINIVDCASDVKMS